MPANFSQNRFARHPVWTFLGLASALLLLLEIGLRLANPEAIAFAYNFRSAYQYDRNWYVDLRPKITTTLHLSTQNGITLQNFLITTNEYGFRCADRLLDDNVRDVPEGTTFIHAIGDSFTMGWGVNYDSCYPELLNFMLSDKTRALNLGVNGFGTIGAVEKSLKLWSKFPAVHVFYLFCDNDFADDFIVVRNRTRGKVYHGWMETIDFFRHHSYVATLPFALSWWQYYRHNMYNATDNDCNRNKTIYQDSPYQFRISDIDTSNCTDVTNPSLEALLQYKKFLADKKARLTVFLPYDKESGNAKIMYHFCKKQDIQAVLLEYPPQLALIKEGHFNKLGNYRLAQLAAGIIKNSEK